MTGAFFTVALLRPRAKHWRPRAARCPGAAAQPLPRRRRGLQALSTWRPALHDTLTRPRARLSRAAFTPLAARKAARASQPGGAPGTEGSTAADPFPGTWNLRPQPRHVSSSAASDLRSWSALFLEASLGCLKRFGAL